MHTLKTLLTASLLVSFSLAGPAMATQEGSDDKTGQSATSSQSSNQQNGMDSNRSPEPGEEMDDATHTSPYKKTYPAEDPVSSGEANETDTQDDKAN